MGLLICIYSMYIYLFRFNVSVQLDCLTVRFFYILSIDFSINNSIASSRYHYLSCLSIFYMWTLRANVVNEVKYIIFFFSFWCIGVFSVKNSSY